MPFPASQQLLVDALRDAQAIANRAKRRTQELKSAAETAPVDRQELIVYMGELTAALNRWATISALPGIVQYARDQFDNQTLNVGAEFTAMVTAATSLRDWIFNAFPKDATSGAWLVDNYDVNGRPSRLQFTVAQLSGFVTRADALIAAIA